MNWVDTPLLVYSLMAGHPAAAMVEQELRDGEWGSTILVLMELYHVLTGDYGQPPAEAVQAVDRLARSPAHWASIDLGQAAAATAVRARTGLESADALLLLLARGDRGILVTSDHRLLRAAQTEGVAARNPISPILAVEIARWEELHLPRKGLPRLLRPVERWLRTRDEALAEEFLEATAHLSVLP